MRDRDISACFLDDVRKGSLAYFQMDNVDFKQGLDLNYVVEGRKP